MRAQGPGAQVRHMDAEAESSGSFSGWKSLDPIRHIAPIPPICAAWPRPGSNQGHSLVHGWVGVREWNSGVSLIFIHPSIHLCIHPFMQQ